LDFVVEFGFEFVFGFGLDLELDLGFVFSFILKSRYALNDFVSSIV
jgi:hypothetical protein